MLGLTLAALAGVGRAASWVLTPGTRNIPKHKPHVLYELASLASLALLCSNSKRSAYRSKQGDLPIAVPQVTPGSALRLSRVGESLIVLFSLFCLACNSRFARVGILYR